jgi:hypothetical protein
MDKRDYVNINDFPSNSKEAQKDETIERKVVSKVTTGKVLKRKKSFGKKVVETFVGEEIFDVKTYILQDVLVPAFKNTVVEMFRDIPELLLFGERRNSRSSSSRGMGRIAYDSMSSRRDVNTREISNRDRATHNFDEIVLTTRNDAVEVLGSLMDLIQDYGQATVADLYDFVGVTGEYTDRKYGWLDLSRAGLRPVRGGFMLDLPRPILVD